MSEEIKNTEAVIEENDKDYDAILDKFENPKDSSPSSKKKNGHIKALIVCIVAAVILAGAGALLIFIPQDNSASETTGSAAIKTEVGKDNVHEVSLKTDSNGKIKENGSGTFADKVPADIKTIEVKNTKGSYTVLSHTPKTKTKETDPDTGKAKYKTGETTYKIKGYEGFELQSGKADEIANTCANLKFNSVSAEDAGSRLKDFGLDKPRAVVKVTFTDNTKSIIKVGNDAAQNLGTYVMYGSGKSVYLCDTETVSKLLMGLTDYISLTITDSVSDGGSTDFTSLSLSGAKFKNTIALKPNSDTTNISNTHIMTSPVNTFADDSETSSVSGAIRGLYAESVAAVNPSSARISGFGLSNPYVKLSAKYSDASITLLASKPDSKGSCYLMKSGGKVVYRIGRASIPWIDTTEEKLISTYVLKPELSALKQMSLSISSKTYTFDINTTETKTTDSDGEKTSTTETKTSYKGKELDEGNFETFFQNANLLTKSDKSAVSVSGTPALTIKYTYTKGRNPDTVKFFKSGTKYIASVNGKSVGTVNANYIEKLISQTPKVSEDKEVKTFW